MPFRTVALLSALAFALAVPPAPADAATKDTKTKELEKKRSFGGLRKKGTAHVQMRWVLAPVKPKRSSKRPVHTPVTVVLTVNDDKKVGMVCSRGPRINDALLQAWWKKPIERAYLFDPRKNKGKAFRSAYRTPEQATEDVRLLAAVNKAVGHKDELVSEILVLAGTRRMGGGGIAKLPFTSVLGCVELEEKKKKKQGRIGRERGRTGGKSTPVATVLRTRGRRTSYRDVRLSRRIRVQRPHVPGIARQGWLRCLENRRLMRLGW